MLLIPFLGINSIAQTRWSINNPEAREIREEQISTFEENLAQYEAMAENMTELASLEKDYNDAKGVAGFGTNSQNLRDLLQNSIVAMELAIIELENAVSPGGDLETWHLTFENRNFDYKIRRERLYWERLSSDFLTASAFLDYTGGNGYLYISYMKMLIRAMKQHRNIMKIKLEYESLKDYDKIFFRERTGGI